MSNGIIGINAVWHAGLFFVMVYRAVLQHILGLRCPDYILFLQLQFLGFKRALHLVGLRDM